MLFAGCQQFFHQWHYKVPNFLSAPQAPWGEPCCPSQTCCVHLTTSLTWTLIGSSAQLHLQTSCIPLHTVTRVFCISSCIVLRKTWLLQRAQRQNSVQNPPQQSQTGATLCTLQFYFLCLCVGSCIPENLFLSWSSDASKEVLVICMRLMLKGYFSLPHHLAVQSLGIRWFLAISINFCLIFNSSRFLILLQRKSF